MIGQTFGHYRVVEEIGSGGMGVVYRAHDIRLDRDVALRVIRPGAPNESCARERFRKEALLLSRLCHPNIAPLYDFDTQDGVDFLIMEYVKGDYVSEHNYRWTGPGRDRDQYGDPNCKCMGKRRRSRSRPP